MKNNMRNTMLALMVAAQAAIGQVTFTPTGTNASTITKADISSDALQSFMASSSMVNNGKLINTGTNITITGVAKISLTYAQATNLLRMPDGLSITNLISGGFLMINTNTYEIQATVKKLTP